MNSTSLLEDMLLVTASQKRDLSSVAGAKPVERETAQEQPRKRSSLLFSHQVIEEAQMKTIAL